MYKPTQQHGNADALSRLPLDGTMKEDYQDETTLYHLNQLSQLPVRFMDIQKETLADDDLKIVLDDLMKGNVVDNPQFSKCMPELSVEQGCLFRGSRIIIPKKLQQRVLEELHSAHVGISRMKSLARAHVWWPQLDSDIKSIVQKCLACSQFQHNPPKAQNHPWEEPQEPFQRVHIDHAGPFRGQSFLLLVDAYTKWLEVFPVNSITSKSTIEKLRETFSRFGLPATLVSDNGASFKSQEFKEFMEVNGINHKTTAPYHPSSNGQVERYVQTLKTALRKMVDDGGNLNLKLSQFLISNRRATHSTTKQTPAKMMLGRNIRTRFDLLHPPQEKFTNTGKEENGNDRHETRRNFEEGDCVSVRVYNEELAPG